MDNFKKTLKKRFITYITLAILFFTVNVTLVILNAFEILKPVATSMGTVYGASVGSGIVLLIYAIKAKNALKNETKLQQLYVASTDERMLFIEKSTANLATNIFVVVLGIAAIIFTYINETIFYTLFYVLIFYLIITLICSLYYNKKY